MNTTWHSKHLSADPFNLPFVFMEYISNWCCMRGCFCTSTGSFCHAFCWRCHLHSHEGTAQTRSVHGLLPFLQLLLLEAHTQTFCMIGGVLRGNKNGQSNSTEQLVSPLVIEESWYPLPATSSAVVPAFFSMLSNMYGSCNQGSTLSFTVCLADVT